MSVRTETRRIFRCDYIHCNIAGNYADDGEAGKQGWAIADINGRKYALCLDHKTQVESPLLQGEWS